MKRRDFEYEVLNPWAEVDPKPLTGLSPRLTDLTGKTVGLFALWKVAARPILTVVEEQLKERYPTLKTSWCFERKGREKKTIDYLTPDEDLQDPEYLDFKDWAKGVDAVVGAIGD